MQTRIPFRHLTNVFEISTQFLTLLPTGKGGGGEGFLVRDITVAARTLEPFYLKYPKISDFSFMLFGHIVAKFQVN